MQHHFTINSNINKGVLTLINHLKMMGNVAKTRQNLKFDRKYNCFSSDWAENLGPSVSRPGDSENAFIKIVHFFFLFFSFPFPFLFLSFSFLATICSTWSLFRADTGSLLTFQNVWFDQKYAYFFGPFGLKIWVQSFLNNFYYWFQLW